MGRKDVFEAEIKQPPSRGEVGYNYCKMSEVLKGYVLMIVVVEEWLASRK